MATLPVYDLNKQQVGEIEVSDSVFATEVKEHLFYEVIKWQLAKRRAGTHATKGRSQVRGGGQKPYRQKGTGRARQGTRRAPQFVGGGTVHGPQPRSHAYPINKKVRRAALCSAFSRRVAEGHLVVVQDLNLGEVKTKKAAQVMSTLAEGNALVIDGPNRELILSVRNLPKVKYLPVEGLNLFDVLKHNYVVLTEPAVRRIEGALAK